MSCSRCNRKEIVDLPYVSQRLCRDCFIKFFEKRIRRTIRRYELLEPEDRTAVVVDGGANSMVVLSILKTLSKKAPKAKLFEIDGGYLKEAKKLKATKLALADDLDDIGLNGLYNFIKGQIGARDNATRLEIIKPLMETPKKEVLLYARLKGIPHKEIEEKNREKAAIARMLADLEGKYPGTAYQLAASMAELENLPK